MSAINFRCRHRYPSGFEIDLAFEITSRFTSLFGPSGSGKTSVLSIIAGMLRPQQGNVRLNDCTLLDTENGVCMKPEDRNVGIVFQDALLFPHLTVERNLEYGFRHRRRRRRTVTFPHVVETLELGGLLQRYPRNLSGGEKQRVALGPGTAEQPGPADDGRAVGLPRRSTQRPHSHLFGTSSRRLEHSNVVRHAQSGRSSSRCRMGRSNRKWPHDLRRSAERGPCASLAPLAWTNSTGPVNLLRIENMALTNGRVMACIGGQFLTLPCSKLPSTSPSFVQFRPSDVIIARKDVAGLSVRNHLRGRVCQVIAVENTLLLSQLTSVRFFGPKSRHRPPRNCNLCRTPRSFA